MMMVSDDCLVECKIDDDSDEDDAGEEQINTPPPPPEFASEPPNPPVILATLPPTYSVNRDPRGINHHLKVEVSDVLAEPVTPQSIDCIWIYSVSGFETARIWTYRCLSLLFAVPCAFLCGIFLAILACLHVWFLVPCIQLSNTFLPCLRSSWMCTVNVFIAPLCMSFSFCCSQIAISLLNKDWNQMKDKDAI
ncbi:caveolin-2 [Embiotoca jacksoni]|uniref:caveolin-2 n=1 Tax=Embiotoca jacksoni TaxID=100190 RepID=UPI003703ED95